MTAIATETLDFLIRDALHNEAVNLACASAMLMCAARLQGPAHIREILTPARSTCVEAIRLLKLLEEQEAASNG